MKSQDLLLETCIVLRMAVFTVFGRLAMGCLDVFPVDISGLLMQRPREQPTQQVFVIDVSVLVLLFETVQNGTKLNVIV